MAPAGYKYGGGVAIQLGSVSTTALLADCTMVFDGFIATNNSAAWAGGGVSVFLEATTLVNDNVTLSDFVLSDNSAGRRGRSRG